MSRVSVAKSTFCVRSEIAGTQVTVHLSGRADAVGAEELKAVLGRVALRQPKRLVFQLSGLETLWSLVLGEMVGCARTVKKCGGTVEVAGASELVRGVFLTCRLDQVFEGLSGDLEPASEKLSLN